MHKGIAGELEHRRGLVLGLTLAEVLLLLLFLLLLALGAEFVELEKRADAAKAEREAREAYARDLETGSLQSPEKLGQIIADLRVSNGKLKASNDELTSELQAITSATKDPAKIIELAKAAKQINPDDPPAVLQRGLAWVKAMGLKTPVPSKKNPQQKDQDKQSGEPPGGEHNWPPIIRLSEAEGYYFASGSAELSEKFKDTLQGQIAVRLLEIIKQYDVNVIEVIGHTDEQPLVQRGSNLDKATSPYLQGTTNEPLVSADNAGLGFARAVSVVRVLNLDHRLQEFSILPLSGAQVIDVGDRLSKDGAYAPAEQRRRIEIRVRRSDIIAAAKTEAGATDGWQSITTPLETPHGPIVGAPVVVDADTIEIGKIRIRIWGIDAIETDQKCLINGQTWDCAEESKSKLTEYLSGKSVSCAPQDTDRFSRVVAKCSIDGADLGEWLVSSGYAVDYPQYSSGAYADQQAQARSAKKGIWRGSFILPWAWRQSQKTEQPPL